MCVVVVFAVVVTVPFVTEVVVALVSFTVFAVVSCVAFVVEAVVILLSEVTGEVVWVTFFNGFAAAALV